MRRPSEDDSARLNALLEAAVGQGIIDSLQGDRLRALALELAPSAVHVAERGDDAPHAAIAPAREARRGFNAVTVAYSLGALLVLVALAWFLFERWSTLGPAGVLAVSAIYAVAFAVVGAALRRRGFGVAGGLAAMLATVMTPMWTWALLRLTGEWPDPLDLYNPLQRYDPYIASRLIVLDLATIGMALAAIRRVRFFALAAPIAVAFIALLIHLGTALGDPRLRWYVGPYYQCVIACATLAVAYAVDRRQPSSDDYAFWFYLAGVVMLFVAYVQLWSSIGAWRHALPLVALALVVASLYLRRRTLVIAGGVAAFGYLGYLAFDVFRRVLALPIALAGLGLLVIVATVWMQRRFPALVARVSREDVPGRIALPTGPIAALGPLAIAMTAMFFAVGEAKERTAEREWQSRVYRHRQHRQIRAQKAAAAAGAPSGAAPDTTSVGPRR